jgi:hypothetical protein
LRRSCLWNLVTTLVAEGQHAAESVN